MSEFPNIDILKTGEPIPAGIKPVTLTELMLQEAQLPRIGFSFLQLQKLLKDQTKFSLPTELAEQLGFVRMRWEMVFDKYALPLLFLGAENESTQPISIDQATGTLAVQRAEDSWKGDVFVQEIILAGIVGGSALAVKYSPALRRAIMVNSSCRESETKGLLGIPTGSNIQYDTAGIITQAMVNATGSFDNRHNVVRVMTRPI